MTIGFLQIPMMNGVFMCTSLGMQGTVQTWTLDWNGLKNGLENRLDFRDVTIAKATLTLFSVCLKDLRTLCGQEGDKNQNKRAPS